MIDRGIGETCLPHSIRGATTLRLWQIRPLKVQVNCQIRPYGNRCEYLDSSGPLLLGAMMLNLVVFRVAAEKDIFRPTQALFVFVHQPMQSNF